jgi:hypothetical protein
LPIEAISFRGWDIVTIEGASFGGGGGSSLQEEWLPIEGISFRGWGVVTIKGAVSRGLTCGWVEPFNKFRACPELDEGTGSALPIKCVMRRLLIKTRRVR